MPFAVGPYGSSVYPVLVDAATAPGNGVALRAAGTILGIGGAPVTGVPLATYDAGGGRVYLDELTAGGRVRLLAGTTVNARFDAESTCYMGSVASLPLGLLTANTVRASCLAAETAWGFGVTAITKTPLALVVGASSHEGARVGGRIYADYSDHATTVLTQEVLDTFTLPANALDADGKGLRIWAVFHCAANGNSKTGIIKFGSTNIAQYTTTGSGYKIDLDVILLRTGAATQFTLGGYRQSAGASGTQTATPAETLSGAVAVTAVGSTPSGAGDITLKAWGVEFLN